MEDFPESRDVAMRNASFIQESEFISSWTQFLALKSEVPADVRRTGNDTFLLGKFDERPRDWVTTIWDAWFDEVRPKPEPTELVKGDELASVKRFSSSHSLQNAFQCPRKEAIDTGLMERFELELDELNKVINANSGIMKSIFLCRRAALNLKMGNLEAALARFKEAINVDGHNIQAKLKVVKHHIKTGYPPAIEDFQLALRIDPRDCNLHFGLALACLMDGLYDLQYKEAVERMKYVIDSGTSDAYSRLLLGKYLVEVGDLKGAKMAIQSVANVNAESMREDKEYYVFLLSFLGEHRRAAAMFHALCSSKPSVTRFLTLGKYQMKAKMYQQAIRTFFAILNRPPAVRYTDLYLYLTRLLFKANNPVQ
ncbi:unnamed protein product [Schistocephalus solidus]|uniref:TPR_REGION domain-containing protein n=1 Tax=Schistocephalus solidus TaxID=70667 RepID=A0A183SUJ6_SCHSO|nr:unnamed protein product [Schistocephalus solidus]